VWAGDDLGSYLTNNWSDSVAGGRGLADNSEILIDGQQCLHSLEEDVLDKVAVPHAQGQPRLWPEIGKSELERYLSRILTNARVPSDDEMALCRTYGHCDRGVTYRTHDQRTIQ